MRYFLIIVLAMVNTSCWNENDTEIAPPNKEQAKFGKSENDSALTKVADLPIHIDSTGYLIHPIGKFLTEGARSNYFNSSIKSAVNFSVSRYNNHEISGNLNNLKFEEVESGRTRLLTDEHIRITSVRFLDEIFKKTKKAFLVYIVTDEDTNQDGSLDNADISSLYISNIDGTKFTKLTADRNELIGWNSVPVKNRLYFKSVEDTNKNEEFDNNDKMTYHFVDLAHEEWKVAIYNPF